MPEHRCILTGEIRSEGDMIRLVVGPDHVLVPDVARKLPGRGLWITASAEALDSPKLEGAVRRAARDNRVRIPPDLRARTAQRLQAYGLNLMSLAKRCGDLVAGYEKCRARLEAEGAGLYITSAAMDSDSRRKLQDRMPADADVIDHWPWDGVAEALGREHVTHIILRPGSGFIPKLMVTAQKLLALDPHLTDMPKSASNPALDDKESKVIDD